MATVLHGDTTFATAMTYGGIQNAMRSYVDQEMARAASLVTGVGQVMFQKAEAARQDFITSNAFRLAEAAIRQVQSLWGTNQVQPLNELWKVQNAPLVMQPLLMANTNLRALYFKQQCDGYSGAYIDLEPGRIGANHSDWQRVMQGMTQVRGEDKDEHEVFVTYAIDEPEVSVPLSFEGQCDVLDAWAIVDKAIAEGVDPSSRWNDDLG